MQPLRAEKPKRLIAFHTLVSVLEVDNYRTFEFMSSEFHHLDGNFIHNQYWHIFAEAERL
jgi:hypothetical protein